MNLQREVALRITAISDKPLDVEAHLSAVDNSAAGAVATFIGQVRDHDSDVNGVVRLLEYEAHPDAQSVLVDIILEVVQARPVRVAVSHRIGSLRVGDIAVIVAVSSPHRALAFDVCREVIESVKSGLPIWKRQATADGVIAWKGLGQDQPPANGGSTSASSD